MILSILTIPFPSIDPVFLRLGPVQLRWYGLMYMLSFIVGYFLLKRLAKRRKLEITSDDLYDLLFFLIVGVMVGGRLGYVLFYDLGGYLNEPLSILKIWQGGMSFHGGFVGSILGAMYIARRKKWNFWEIADIVSVAAPLGLGLGRVGNFVNGELFGRPTTLPWGMVFPDGGELPRHPSQLYEALLEGLVLYLVVRWIFNKNLAPGTVFWSLVCSYGVARFLVEFVREPDAHLGLQLGPFTRGQLLTAPMVLLGAVMAVTFSRRHLPEKSQRQRKSRAQ